MQKLSVALLLAALALPILVVGAWIGSTPRRPAGLLASARERLASPEPDYDRALHELDRGIALAEREGDRSLERALCMERARLFDARGDAGLAALASEEILLRFDPRDAEALALGAGAELRAGAFERARGLAERLARSLPREPEGPRLAGEAGLQISNAHLAELETTLAAAHSRSTARTLHAEARRNASLPEDHPARRRFERLLSLSLPEAEREGALSTFRSAANEREHARTSFESCLALVPDGRAVAGLQTLFLSAGRAEDAADLGSFALDRQDLLFAIPVAIQTGTALFEAGRSAALREFLAEQSALLAPDALRASALADGTLLDWCRVLVLSENWNELAGTAWVATQAAHARSRKSGAPPPPSSFFFLAAAERRLGRPTADVAAALGPAQGSDLAELGEFLGDYWMLEADLARLRGRSLEERTRLLHALQEFPAPESGRGRTISGFAWKRLGEIALANAAPVEAERCFAQALARLPSERTTLEALWEQAGQAAKELSRRPPGSRDPSSMGSYEACALAQARLARGSAQEVELLLAPVLADFPGFPVALELLARALHLRGDEGAAIEAVLELGERGFPNRSVLDELPRSSFTLRQLARGVATASESARVDFAAERARSGDRAEAERLLSEVQGSAYPAREVARGAALLAELGHPEVALERIASLPADTPQRSAAVLAVLERALAAQDPILLRRGVALALETSGFFDEPGFLPLVDRMVSRGELLDAWALLNRAEVAQRGPGREILFRKALVMTLDRNAAEADPALDRCEPFTEGGAVELGRLLRAIDDEDPLALSDAASALLATPLAREPFPRALFLALRGDADEALPLLDGLERSRSGPFLPHARAWIEARAGSPRPADGSFPALADLPPERGLAWLAGLAVHPWAFWTAARIRELPENLRATPWAAILEAEALRDQGDLERAERRLEPYTTGTTGERESLAEAWCLHEEIAQEILAPLTGEARRAAFEHLAEVRAERIAVAGPRGSSPAEIALALAVHANRAGEVEPARALLERAFAEDPEDLLLARELARVSLAAGDPARAAALRIGLLERASREEARELAPEALEALRAARAAGALTDRAVRLELEALAASRPDDPLLARALAQDLGRDRRASIEPLERFLAAHPQASIEELRPGEARHWCELVRALDPARAEALARSELEHAPFSLALWRELVDALHARGQRSEALERAQSLLGVVRDPLLEARATLLRAELAAPSSRAALALEAAVLARDGDLRLRALLARLGGSQEERAESLADAERAWADRTRAELSLEPLAHRYAVALSAADPRSALAVLEEALGEAQDPLDRSLLFAFHALLTVSGEQASLQELASPE